MKEEGGRRDLFLLGFLVGIRGEVFFCETQDLR